MILVYNLIIVTLFLVAHLLQKLAHIQLVQYPYTQKPRVSHIFPVLSNRLWFPIHHKIYFKIAITFRTLLFQ